MKKRGSFLNPRMLRGKTTSIGIDVGSYSIKIVELSESEAGISLVNYVIKEFPAEARGRDKRKSPLWGETIKEVLKQFPAKPDYLTIAFSGPSVAMQRIRLPLMPYLEIEPAIRWEGKKQFTFPLENSKIIFQEREEQEEDGVKKMDLLVVAAQSEPLEQEIAAFQEICPSITGFDIVSFGLQYTYRQMGKGNEEETYALIHIGAGETSICILKGDQLQFSREISVAGNDLTQALTEPFAAEGKKFSLSLARAEEIKRRYGIPLGELQGKTEEGIPLSRIMFIIRPTLETLVSEITRSFNFYKIQLKEEKGIDRIFLSGGSAQLKNLKEYLTSGLGIEVAILDPFHNMALDIKEHEISDLTKVKSDLSVAIGMALGKAQEINFFPPKPKLLESNELKRYIFYLFPFLFLCLLTSSYYRIDQSVKSYQRELSKIKSTFSALSGSLNKLNALKKEKEELEKKLSVLPSLPTQPPYPAMIKTINRLIPANISLKRILLAGKKSANINPLLRETSEAIRMEGIVFGSDTERLTTLANFTEALEKSPFFTSINLVSTGNDEVFSQATDFTLLCSLTPSPS